MGDVATQIASDLRPEVEGRQGGQEHRLGSSGFHLVLTDSWIVFMLAPHFSAQQFTECERHGDLGGLDSSVTFIIGSIGRAVQTIDHVQY